MKHSAAFRHPATPSFPGAVIEGHGMRGGPAGRRWSWRGAVPSGRRATR